jgi:hypothetical protein
MKASEFRRYLERDGHHCLHCGTDQGLVPNHRADRGAGGFKGAEIPSNVVVMCGAFNGLIEADADAAELARTYGWKLRSWELGDSLILPVYDRAYQGWFYLDNDYHRTGTGWTGGGW